MHFLDLFYYFLFIFGKKFQPTRTERKWPRERLINLAQRALFGGLINLKCLNGIIIKPLQQSLSQIAVMYTRKRNQLKLLPNSGMPLSNREIFEVGDDAREAEVDEIDDFDCCERG